MPKKTDILESELLNLQQMTQRIEQEINAVLLPSNNETDHFQNASEQLCDITKITQKAADAIMEAAELSDANISTLRSIVSDNIEADEILNQMTANTQKMFEACTFQDITGQRVSIVKDSLSYIEERINSINQLLDGRLPDSPTLDVDDKTEDDKLLNGPQLEGEGLKQSDVDALFD